MPGLTGARSRAPAADVQDVEVPGTPAPDVVLLAAGRGSRLGGDTPKPLTPLPGGETLIGRQVRLLAPLLDAGSRLLVVVGHRADDLRAALPLAEPVLAPHYATTNTATSLLCALAARPSADRGLLWLNSDVVFSGGFASRVVQAATAGESFVAVRRGRTADEEVKYRLDAAGRVTALSKTVRGGEGEAVGVNHVSAADRAVLTRALAACGPGDYFEAAVEATAQAGTTWTGLDLTDHFAVEVDFPEDLAVARAWLLEERAVPAPRRSRSLVA